MTEGDYETFYPYLMGVGKGAPNNFESSFDDDNDPDLDDSNDDQENTGFEDEDLIDGLNEQQLPCYRELVREKKSELKQRFGKGKFRELGTCGLPPVKIDPKYNPQTRIATVYYPSRDCGINPDLRINLLPTICIWDCSKSKNSDKDCCVENRRRSDAKRDAWAEFSACREQNGKVMIQGNEEAWAIARDRYNEDEKKYKDCLKTNKLWQPGWRKEWRKFKKSGGLKELKTKSVRCVLGAPVGNTPIKPPTITPIPKPIQNVIVKPTPKPSPKPSPKSTTKPSPKPIDNKVQDISKVVDTKSGMDTMKYVIIGIIALVLIVSGILIYKEYKK